MLQFSAGFLILLNVSAIIQSLCIDIILLDHLNPFRQHEGFDWEMIGVRIKNSIFFVIENSKKVSLPC